MSFSHVQLFENLWAVARQAPLTMGFPSQEYWTGFPFPSPGYLPSPGIKPVSSALAGGFLTTEPPGKPKFAISILISEIKPRLKEIKQLQ